VRIRLGGKLRRDFESGDILHESFRVAVQKFEDFELSDEANFIGWLRTIVEHQITDKVDYVDAACRSRGREVEIDATGADGEPAAIHQPSSPRTAPLDALVRQEGAAQVETYLSQLEPAHRDLIVLRDYEGHSWGRIAELLDRPSPDAARMMYNTALFELGKRIVRGRTGASDA
jgi:RNA polymerase sigma factor (sigma-70 family)